MTTEYSVSKFGAVATPPQIIQYMVDVLLKFWDEHRGTTRIAEKFNILDPAVGDGRFLINFAMNFKERVDKKNWKETLHCYGLDINPKTTESANTNIEESKDLELVEVSLKIGNALLGFISRPEGWNKTWSKHKLNNSYISSHNLKEMDIQRKKHLFHWFLEWPEVIRHSGFDIVLGNPPYGISFSREEKILFRKLYQGFDPEMESYILFIERSIQLTREGGFIGLIIPSNLLSNYRYQNIRQYLLDNVKILKIANLDRQIFLGFHVETCVLFLQRLTPQKERNNHEIQFEIIKDVLNPPFRVFDKQRIIQKEIQENTYKILLPKYSATISSILKKIQRNSTPLGEMVSISRGIELGFHSSKTSDQRLDLEFMPLIAGRSIRKFRLKKELRYIRFDKNNKSIFKDFNLYLQPKLLLRRIGHELISVYDPNQHFCVCDVYMIILQPNRPTIELIYLEALLNSRLMSFYLMQRYTSVKQIFPKIAIAFLKDLPIKKPSNLIKIQELVNDLHQLPWDIQQAKSHQLKQLKDLNQEIFKIYALDNYEKNIITKTFHNFEKKD